MTQQTLANDLIQRAVCNTDHPADAAGALMLAAGVLLQNRFGDAGAVSLLRECVAELEAKLVAAYGKQPGEAVQ